MKRELLNAIRKKLKEQGRVVVAIEGSSGAGKTTLASEIAERFNARVFHADDYFLQPFQRTEARMKEVGGNFDRERFAVEVAAPVREGRDAACRGYDCSVGSLKNSFLLPFVPVTVVEGCYCTHPEIEKYWDISVFLFVAPHIQRERILARNGEEMLRRFMTEWIPRENAYFAQMRAPESCDMLFSKL